MLKEKKSINQNGGVHSNSAVVCQIGHFICKLDCDLLGNVTTMDLYVSSEVTGTHSLHCLVSLYLEVHKGLKTE
jgi:hypothetical protein